MKTPNLAHAIIPGLIIALVQAITSSATAQITRQESANPLKKVVYTFNPSECPQMVAQTTDVYRTCTTDDGLGNTNTFPYVFYKHFAIMSIPEITLSNMPSIQVWRNATETPQGWLPVPATRLNDDWGIGSSYYGLYFDGGIGILWKTETRSTGANACPDLQVTNIFATKNRVVVVYETPATPAPLTLAVGTSPTGISLTVPTKVGQTYAVEYSPALPPTSSWALLATNLVGTGGPLTVSDTNLQTQRFYRALSQ